MMALQHHPSDMMYARAIDQFECALCGSGRAAEDHGDRLPSLSLRRAAPHRPRGAHLRGDSVARGRRRLGRRQESSTGISRDASNDETQQDAAARLSQSAFVPHDLKRRSRRGERTARRPDAPWSRTCTTSPASAPAAAIRNGSQPMRPPRTTVRRCRKSSTPARPSSARRSATNSSTASPAPTRTTARR